MASNAQELTVRSESVQQLYNLYIADKFEVNRRYQRKLVWSVEEKEKLIDSMLRALPLPLFLVAEVASDSGNTYELIDGLQRLNAIFAFLENEFAIDGKYFDLDSLADTKLKKDRGVLQQKTPVLDRALSTGLANYAVALSVYRAADESSVEEVFRRINSGGRRLSRQSLRQAGTISTLADLVRDISSRVRGDTSPDVTVPLRRMPQLSITNYDLDYGVNVDEIFWVRNGILRREDVRESLDEQLVLDILIDCLIEPAPTTGTRTRDEYYSYGPSDTAPSKASLTIAAAISTYGSDQILATFMRTYDQIRAVLRAADKKFSSLVGAQTGGRAPRYFHVVFLAFYELMVRDRLRLRNYALAAQALNNIGAGPLSVPAGGGDWRPAVKRSSIDAVKGVLRSSFEGPVEGDDLATFSYASQLETLLGNALVEQQLFECKQGLLSLSSQRLVDEASIVKIAKTISAMANMGRGSVGYIAVGIADTQADADRVKALDAVEPEPYRGFHIVGIEREARLQAASLNDYWLWFLQKLGATSLEPTIMSAVVSSARLVAYHGLAVGILRVHGGSEPNFYDGQLHERAGAQTVVVPQSDYLRIFQSFTQSG